MNTQNTQVAVKVGRAWGNKLDHIVDFFIYLVDQGVLSAADAREKDIVSRAYYRYYNDGDFPRCKLDTRFHVEKGLEIRVNELFSKLLSKYYTEERKRAFQKHKQNTRIKAVASCCKMCDVSSSIYMLNNLPQLMTKGIDDTIKRVTNNSVVLSNYIASKDSNQSGFTVEAQVKHVKDTEIWDAKCKNIWGEITKDLTMISDFFTSKA